MDKTVDNEIERTAEIDEFWADARIDLVRLALPAGVGYTLRAYLNSEDVPEAVDEADEDVEDSALAEGLDDTGERNDLLVTQIDDTEDQFRSIIRRDERSEERGDDDIDDELEDVEEPPAEEFADEKTEPFVPEGDVPVFLSRRNKVILFRSEEGLLNFVTSGAPTSLSFLDGWDEFAAALQPSHMVADEEDTYELDLLVENLRGGHDAWEPELIISAGEAARDLGYALHLKDVQAALSPNSPLDELDNALRKTVDGGMGAFLARRRIKKVGAEQAALAWRTIIGKISAATDWRD